MHPTLELIAGLRTRVGRRPYITWGLGLAAAKFLIDTAVVYGFSHKTWTPLGYVVPSLVLRDDAVGPVPDAMHVLLVVLAMPFLWIGLSMSVRRAADAGRSPWLGVGFLVPFLNYLTILFLCVVPSHDAARWSPQPDQIYRQGRDEPPPSKVELPLRVRAALLGILASIVVGMAMIGISVYWLGLYGWTLFFATPFAMGATTSAVYNAKAKRRLRDTLGLTIVATVLTGSILLLFAIEGILCLAMAFPIALVISIFGAIVARAIVTSTRRDASGATLVIAALPFLAVGESRLPGPVVRDVTTSIEIAAPPEVVWSHVIGFSSLPEPPRWQYRLGVAYPMRATIDGEGVGAVRRCVFSTGPFVEPITVWDPPRRLAFDVTQQPPSMTEWSPYRDLHAPHLEGYMTSRGGEFRLVSLPGNRTRLEGTTHYTMAIYPEMYWRGFAELLLHGIHERVLTHIKQLSEASEL
ncbi:MAG: SRPBCC family protein [Polyangiaceae bacterium]